jgi:hypothetical protein
MGRAHDGGCPAICLKIFLGGGEILVFNISGVAWGVQVLASDGSLV